MTDELTGQASGGRTGAPPTDETIAVAPPPVGAGRRLLVPVAALVALVLVAAVVFRGSDPSTAHYVALSMLLFATGAFGVLVRRNALVLFMCIELMFNAVNIAVAAFARMHVVADGHVIMLFVMIVEAAEVAIGLAIIVSIFRRRQSANVDDLALLKW